MTTIRIDRAPPSPTGTLVVVAPAPYAVNDGNRVRQPFTVLVVTSGQPTHRELPKTVDGVLSAARRSLRKSTPDAVWLYRRGTGDGFRSDPVGRIEAGLRGLAVAATVPLVVWGDDDAGVEL